MGFHITQPGSSVAKSLIDGESKPKHVLLLEIKGNQYRPTKIPLTSVRLFEYTEIVLKDEPEIDPNDPNSILEHLDKVVNSLIEKSMKNFVSGSHLQLPLVRIKTYKYLCTYVCSHCFSQCNPNPGRCMWGRLQTHKTFLYFRRLQ